MTDALTLDMIEETLDLVAEWLSLSISVER
jgi:hypothetical protein